MFSRTKINIIDNILFAILALLLILYIVSFTKSCSSTDKRDIVKSAIINKKYANEIDSFQFMKGNDVLLLSKINDIWYVNSDKMSGVSLPADTSRIQKLIEDLISIQNMYKLSDKLTTGNSFGLTDSDAFIIRYHFSDSFNDIIFGNQDFALSSRYMMSGKSTTIYEIPNTFDKYLTTSIQSWTEPYIISQQILGPIKGSDIQRTFVTFEGVTAQNNFNDKLLELRHGGFPMAVNFSKEVFNNSLMTIKLELGNKNIININIAGEDYNNEQEYNVEVEYINVNAECNFKSYSKISSWTYNKIKEIML